MLKELDECEEGQGLQFLSGRAVRDIVVPLVLEFEAVGPSIHLAVFRASTGVLRDNDIVSIRCGI